MWLFVPESCDHSQWGPVGQLSLGDQLHGEKLSLSSSLVCILVVKSYLVIPHLASLTASSTTPLFPELAHPAAEP